MKPFKKKKNSAQLWPVLCENMYNTALKFFLFCYFSCYSHCSPPFNSQRGWLLYGGQAPSLRFHHAGQKQAWPPNHEEKSEWEKNVMWIRQTVIFLLSFRFRNHFFPLTLFHRLKNKCFQSLEDLCGLANNERFVFYGFYWKNHLANFLASENLNFLPFPTCHLWQSVISHV